MTLFYRPNTAQCSSTASSTVVYQAKLADKYAVLNAVQGFRQPVCLHRRRTHKLQQNMSFPHLLVDPFVADIYMLCTGSLEGVEYGQPGILVVRMNEQWCSLWVSGLSTDLCDPLDVEGCQCEVNKLGLSGRDHDNCLFPALLNDWATGQEDHIAFCGDSYK